jgi:hypothetical protein
MKVNLTVKVDRDISDRLAAISVAEGRSQGELGRRAVRAHYGMPPPGQALARALGAVIVDAPRPGNGQGEHG